MEVNKNMNEVKVPNATTQRAIEESRKIIENRMREVYSVEVGNLDPDVAKTYLEHAATRCDSQLDSIGFQASGMAEAEKFRQSRILSNMVEVELTRQDAFLIIKETLTRIGVASEGQNKLHQSCHILHKAGKYYITHFKLLFELDGKPSNIDQMDRARQNTIALLLESWGLVNILSDNIRAQTVPMKTIKIVPASEKKNWELISKHRIGKK